MPRLIAQDEKAESTKKLQIKTADRGIVQKIIRLDTCGWKPKQIADEVCLSGSRISIIMHSPMYVKARDDFANKLESKTIDKESTKEVEGDYVTQKIKTLARDAIDTKAELLDSEMDTVRSAVSSDILDRAGYAAKKETRVTTISMSEKVAERIEKVMGYDESAKYERNRQVKVTQEVPA